MSAVNKPRKVTGKFSAKPAGRPRALTDEECKAIQMDYLVWRSPGVLEASKIASRSLQEKLQENAQIRNGLIKKAVDAAFRKYTSGIYIIRTLSEKHRVSERVIIDVLKNRGAYANSGWGKIGKKQIRLMQELDWLEEKIKEADKVTDKTSTGT